jgi:hypothetical protein
MGVYKTKSDEYIASLGIEPYSFLPDIHFDEHNTRPAFEVKARLVILCMLVEVSFNRLSADAAKAFLMKNGLTELLSEKELKLLSTNDAVHKVNETWKIECICVLYWYLGIIDHIPAPTELFDFLAASYYPVSSLDNPPDIFTDDRFTVRSTNELDFLLDLYSRLDYICDMAKVNNYKLHLDSAAVYERRYALIWLSDNTIANWDDVKCNSIY